MGYIVAVDGPAGSGKGTITKKIEKELGLMNLDTGITYRAVAYLMLKQKISLNEEEKVINIAKNLNLEISKENGNDAVYLDGENITKEIRTKEVTNIVSYVSSIIEVRKYMVDLQRKIASNKDVIVEGRDIGTVVFPNANVKIYLDATPEMRAKRRQKQNEDLNINTTYEEVLKNVNARDYNDMNKPVGALKRSDDAIYIDCTNMSIDEVVKYIKDLIIKDKNK